MLYKKKCYNPLARKTNSLTIATIIIVNRSNGEKILPSGVPFNFQWISVNYYTVSHICLILYVYRRFSYVLPSLPLIKPCEVSIAGI